MKNNISHIALLLILSLCHVYNAFGSDISVVTSITPIASLVSMIGGQNVKVFSVLTNAQCPHHYTLKPSDISHIKDANLYLYIDQNFDIFAKRFAYDKKHTIEISKLRDIVIEGNNLHLWLLPKNAEIILGAIAQTLSDIAPHLQKIFESNLSHSLDEIAKLEARRVRILQNTNHINLLSDSAEYLFLKSNKYRKLYNGHDSLGVKSINHLSRIKNDKDTCFVADAENVRRYKHILGESLIGIDTENWAISPSDSLELLYYKKYSEILDKIESACSSLKK